MLSLLLAVMCYHKRTILVDELMTTLFDPGESLDQASFNAEATKRINSHRHRAAKHPLASAVEMQSWLSQRAAATGITNPSATITALQENLPAYADIEARLFTARRLTDILEEIGYWTTATVGNYSHLCTFLLRNPANPKSVECIVIAARKLPFFEPHLLSQEHAEFCARCTICGHEHPAVINRDVRGLVLKCPSCTKPYDMLCQDLFGDYRHVNHFLTGFSPPSHFSDELPRLEQMLTIWKTVIDHCRYTSDITGVAGQRDQWQVPSQTHGYANGDCEDTSILLTDWLISRGFHARVALGVLSDGDGRSSGHAWVVCRLDGIDYLLESTNFDVNFKLPPTVASFGHLYSPRMLFDRDHIYFRKNEGWTPDYWSRREWNAVDYGNSDDPKTNVNPFDNRAIDFASAADTWLGAKKATDSLAPINAGKAASPLLPATSVH